MDQIVCLVEGQGDFLSVPILLRRLLPDGVQEFQSFQIDNQPLKIGGITKLTKGNYSEFRRFIRQTLKTKRSCKAIMLIIDGDTKTPAGLMCPKTIGPNFAKIAQEEGAGSIFSFAAVIIMREYESWFLASVDDPKFQELGVIDDGKIEFSKLEEYPRGASERLNKLMLHSEYDKTIHQPEFTRVINLDKVAMRMRSFRRMQSAAQSLFNALIKQHYIVSPI